MTACQKRYAKHFHNYKLCLAFIHRRWNACHLQAKHFLVAFWCAFGCAQNFTATEWISIGNVAKALI